MSGAIAGVDVGGTNTDAVVVDRDGTIRARIKVPTTPDPAEGIVDALRQVVGSRSVARVSFGTTHALNAIVRRQGLRRVALIRLGSPGTEAIPPLTGWPDDLAAATSAGAWIARGGVEIDGRHVAVDPAEIVRIAGEIASDGEAGAIAVVGTFSPLDASQERQAAARLADATGLPVSISSEIGGLGLLERENATVLNAALGDLVERLVHGLVTATSRLGGDGTRAYLTQNDGTLMTIDHARRVPVLMVGAGPSNSLRGAAVLSGRTDVLIVDVGGTSADVGALVHGFPRESAAGVAIGGVQTNFRMPDLVSVPVGGGTIIRPDGSLGIDSVGARLTTESMVFGGASTTLTDAAVAAGRVNLGDPDRIAPGAFGGALAEADDRIAGAVDRMLLGSPDVDLVAVGGGSVLLPDRLPGVRCVERPADADVANAVGAALAPVAGEADFVADVSGDLRQREMDRALGLAGERAVAAGARGDALETVWIDEVPLAYVERSISRIRAKVAGPAAETVP